MKRPGGRSPEQIEIDRILALPVERWPDAEDVEIESFERLLAEAFTRGERLFPAQVASLWAFEKAGGGLLPVGVGFGKTGIGLMISQIALSRGLARKVLWLLPVHLVASVIRRHVPEWRRRVPLSANLHTLSGRSREARRKMAESGGPGIYILPYSLLSATDTMDLLRAINPDLIVADEVHKLKNPRAACTRRVMHYLKSRDPAPAFLGMSGTITSKGVMDYHHLIDAALRDGSPLPRSHNLAATWGLSLDSGASPPAGLAESTMGPLAAWARCQFPDDPGLRGHGVELYRTAYRRRLVTAPGVVSTGDERPAASLQVLNQNPGDPSPELQELITQASEEFETPEGEPIDHAIHVYKWLHELSAGFYNALVWPTAEEVERNRKVAPEEAEWMLDRARKHLKAQQRYHAALRDFFDGAPPGLDTPREVGRAIAAHGDRFVGGVLAQMWQEVKDLDFPGRPERKQVPVRVDPYKMRAAVSWAKEIGKDGGILWVYHQEVGRWLVEELRAAGLDPAYAPAGEDEVLEAVGDPVRGGHGDRLVVASLPAHGVGRNLQAFRTQLFVQWPRAAALAEQALGRLHRTGQQADEVEAWTLLSEALEFDHVNRAATLNDAVYIQSTVGMPQRVIYADYDPLPRVYPPEFLRQRGASPEMLDEKMRQRLKEAFGMVS